jgi:hypothetical protein
VCATCTPIANVSGPITCTTASDSQATACIGGYNLVEGTANTCVPASGMPECRPVAVWCVAVPQLDRPGYSPSRTYTPSSNLHRHMPSRKYGQWYLLTCAPCSASPITHLHGGQRQSKRQRERVLELYGILHAGLYVVVWVSEQAAAELPMRLESLVYKAVGMGSANDVVFGSVHNHIQQLRNDCICRVCGCGC